MIKRLIATLIVRSSGALPQNLNSEGRRFPSEIVQRSRARQIAKLLTGASLALLAMAWLSPAAAVAGCSHPAHLHAASPDRPVHFDLLSHVGALPTAHGHDAPAAPLRCSGPSCSEDSPPPSAPGAPTIPKSSRAEQFCMLNLPPFEPNRLASAVSISACGEHDLELVSELLRPPRPTSA